MKKVVFNDLKDIEKKMLDSAVKCRGNAYAPYSNFKVGAAVLSEKGNIYSGCNVESADLTLTTHAEMNAIDSMVSCGEKAIKEILIVMETDFGCSIPCGLCRQKILEFAAGKTEIIGVNLDKKGEIRSIYRTTINELLPHPFKSEYFK